MKKFSGKLALLLALLLLATVCLTACSGGDTKKEDTADKAPAAAGFTGDKFSFDGALPIKNADLPEGYTPVPHETFLAAYKALVDSIGENPTVTTSSTYADIAALFGTEGIQVPNKSDTYVTYYWISDKEENVNRNVFVSVTFKKSGGNMTYYAYSSTDIMPEEVR